MNIIIAAAVPLIIMQTHQREHASSMNSTIRRPSNIEEKTSENRPLQRLNSVSTTGMQH
jgi:hypothetical protein